jgi:hypothetical protein
MELYKPSTHNLQEIRRSSRKKQKKKSRVRQNQSLKKKLEINKYLGLGTRAEGRGVERSQMPPSYLPKIHLGLGRISLNLEVERG